MSNDRTPLAKRSFLITPEGARVLENELDFLWRQERPRVTQEVSDAAKLGDRSENAEYIYGKRRLRQIDSRVRFLRKRLENLTIVDQPPSDLGRIYFGAWVVLEDEEENEHRYRLVGEDEINPGQGYISIDAPLARGLLGKRCDDEVSIRLPKGMTTFYVVAIAYSRPGWDQAQPLPDRWARG